MTEANKQRGKNNRKSGADFEKRVRSQLESFGFVVSRWLCNVEGEEVIQAKYNKFNRYTGFPDFICVDPEDRTMTLVECKKNGKLTPEEKNKIKVLQQKGLNIFIAKQSEEGITYELQPLK